jgi:hypothetical protein
VTDDRCLAPEAVADPAEQWSTEQDPALVALNAHVSSAGEARCHSRTKNGPAAGAAEIS